jgi:hypothetical protein
MNLEDIQTNAFAAISRIFEVSSSGVPVLLDDGTYPKVDGREEYLRTKGVCIIIMPIRFDELTDSVRSGFAAEEIILDVLIEENVKLNRSAAGTGVSCEKAIRLIREGISGRPNVSAPNSPNSDAPFTPFRYDGFWGPEFNNGARQAAVFFRVKCFITPTNKDPQ